MRTQRNSGSTPGVVPLDTVASAAQMLGVSPDAVRAAMDRGDLPAVRIAGSIRLLRRDIQRLAGEEVTELAWPDGIADLDALAIFFPLEPSDAPQADHGEFPARRVRGWTQFPCKVVSPRDVDRGGDRNYADRE